MRLSPNHFAAVCAALSRVLCAGAVILCARAMPAAIVSSMHDVATALTMTDPPGSAGDYSTGPKAFKFALPPFVPPVTVRRDAQRCCGSRPGATSVMV